MTPITTPLHLLIPTLISLGMAIFLFVKKKSLRSKNKLLFKSGLIFFFSYALLVSNALGHDIYYQWNLNHYDLDQDGLFSSVEITPAQKLAMERLTNDTSRNLSPIHACIVSGILSLAIYSIARVKHVLFEDDNPEQKNNLTHTY